MYQSRKSKGLDLGFYVRGNLRGLGLGGCQQRGALALSAAIAHDETEPERHDGGNDSNEHVKNSYVETGPLYRGRVADHSRLALAARHEPAEALTAGKLPIE